MQAGSGEHTGAFAGRPWLGRSVFLTSSNAAYAASGSEARNSRLGRQLYCLAKADMGAGFERIAHLNQVKTAVLHCLAFAALLCYGLMVDPTTGGGIPCLWKTLFGINCPGCGLSRAGALLLHGHLVEAARMNWLVFPVASVFGWKFLMEIKVLYKSCNSLMRQRGGSRCPS
jgi:hypothetical protein